VIASKDEPNVGRERRIIERPRLIKLLDESEARIILLLAPAGYGKTTLARQWAKTLNRVIWVTLTPAHRDVVTLAEDIATGIESLGGGSTEFIREYLRAQSNPQRAAHGVALELSKQMNDVGVQWLVFDDCQEVSGATEACALISALTERLDCRMLMSSRERPAWTRSRQVVYGKVSEFGRAELAMTRDEVAEVLGPRTDLTELALQAEGWPAVLGLVAALDAAAPLRSPMPEALHRYLAEELFQSASETLRENLLTPRTSFNRIRRTSDPNHQSVQPPWISHRRRPDRVAPSPSGVPPLKAPRQAECRTASPKGDHQVDRRRRVGARAWSRPSIQPERPG